MRTSSPLYRRSISKKALPPGPERTDKNPLFGSSARRGPSFATTPAVGQASNSALPPTITGVRLSPATTGLMDNTITVDIKKPAATLLAVNNGCIQSPGLR